MVVLCVVFIGRVGVGVGGVVVIVWVCLLL